MLGHAYGGVLKLGGLRNRKDLERLKGACYGRGVERPFLRSYFQPEQVV